MIYTDRLSKFLLLSMFFHLPMILFTGVLLVASVLTATDTISESTSEIAHAFIGTGLGLATALGAYLIVGTSTWIVAQTIAVPLRPIRVRDSLLEAKKKWKTFAGTGLLSALGQFGLSFAACVPAFLIPFVILGAILGFGTAAAIASLAVAAMVGVSVFLCLSVLWTLVSPVVMMENARGIAAIKRSTALVRRSLVTSIAAVLIMFLLPALVASTISLGVSLSAKGLRGSVVQTHEGPNGTEVKIQTGDDDGDDGGVKLSVGKEKVGIIGMDAETEGKLQKALLEVLMQIVLLPVQIVMTSFTAIILALLYLKTRQAGGETTRELVERFRGPEAPMKKWQQRVRQRLIQSGRTSKPTG